MITFTASGEPNFYNVDDGDKWVAVIQLNGEMLVAEQEEKMEVIVAALRAADVRIDGAEIARYQQEANEGAAE